MGDIVFVDGLRAYVPNPKAPPHIKARLSMNVAQLIDWLRAQTPDDKGEVRAELCESKNGKYYCRLDTYKPAPRDGSFFAPPKPWVEPQPSYAPPKPPPAQPSASNAQDDDNIPF